MRFLQVNGLHNCMAGWTHNPPVTRPVWTTGMDNLHAERKTHLRAAVNDRVGDPE
jgi:hypothetical protein